MLISKKIVHLTSVHPRHDTRIFIKQCNSLAAHGYDVTLVVADGKADECKGRVKIIDVGYLPGRFNRMFKTTRRVLEKAIELDADVYHLHDPELIPIGLKLKRLGKRVIFDSHEDVPTDILDKPYINYFSRVFVSKIYQIYERLTLKRFDAIIAATPCIRDKLSAINVNTIDINNYPIMGELMSGVVGHWSGRQHQIAYVGGIGLLRGIREIVHALEFTTSNARLQLAGEFGEPEVKAEVINFTGWQYVDELGFLNREEVSVLLSRCMAGLVTFHPLSNHVSAQPNKMFEYMSAGIPVIASNFPLWREIVEGNDCGLCVDPLDPKAIAQAIDFIINNPERARQMGEDGQRAVQTRYNWGVEEAKLLKVYAQVLGEA